MFRGSNGDRTFDTGLRGEQSDSWCVYDATAADLRFAITTNGDVNIPNDSKKLQLGASQDLQIYHDGSHSNLTNSTGNFKIETSTGDLYLKTSGDDVHIRAADNVHIESQDGSEKYALFQKDGNVELYYDNSKKLETVSNLSLIHI